MKLLLTGGSGFLGNTINTSLKNKIENVDCIGRAKENEIISDLTKEITHLYKTYDYVIHCAGKAHSNPKTENEKQSFFDVNLTGTQNLCKALENQAPLRGFVFISTVAVYGKEFGSKLDEQTPLLAKDPYGLSKIQAEFFLQTWCKHRQIPLLILRLPLVIGENAPGNYGAMVNAIQKGYYMRIGNGSTKRSMVMASDIAEFISKNLGKEGIYNLTDGYDPTFKELEEVLKKKYHKKFIPTLPYFIVKLIAILGDILGKRFPINSNKLQKITSNLTFSSIKVQEELGWKPRRVLDYL